MKYTFDVDEKNNKFEIRLEITKTGGYNSTAAKTIECSEFNPNWTVSLEKLLVDIIDNMRLTVKELKYTKIQIFWLNIWSIVIQ